jgi:hypothetical protein
VKRSEVKPSEVVYIHGRDSSDYVATSYILDGPGSFPGSILVLYVFFSYFLVFSCIFCVFLYFLFLVFRNVHMLVLYLCICTVLYCGCLYKYTCTVKIRAMYCAVFARCAVSLLNVRSL